MSSGNEILRYDRMVESALRGVVRQSIKEVMKDGLPGDHHFYITFMTDHPGVKMPEYLKERYPGEMTIVLQYQFYDLSIENDAVCVTLSFNNIPEKLVIPIESVSIFADPSVNFALQFQPISQDIDDLDEFDLLDEDEEDGADNKRTNRKEEEKTGEVISLDSFRKKD